MSELMDQELYSMIKSAELIINSQFQLLERVERIDLKLRSFNEISNEFEQDITIADENLSKKLKQFKVWETSAKVEQNELKEDQKKDKKMIQLQKNYNRYVKLQVKKRFGENYLEKHQVRELDFEIMQKIKKNANRFYPSKNISPKVAWDNAMNSLRQFRHQQQIKNKL